MSKNNEIDNNNFVAKQTLVGAIVLSLFVGFFGGTIYSSFKLASDNKGQQPRNTSTANNQVTSHPSHQHPKPSQCRTAKLR